MATVQAGDAIVYTYTAMLENRKVIEMSSEDVAKKIGSYDPERFYGPREVTVGSGKLLPGLDRAVIGMSEEEEKVVVLSPEQGYGERDRSRIRRVPRSAFEKRDIVAKEGMRVKMSGGIAWVTNVSEEEVEVDLNHPLAGRTLIVHIKVERIESAQTCGENNA